MNAIEILAQAKTEMEDRAKTYDRPEGERSMGRTVTAFAAVTGVTLTETQGWLFMALLKAVRSQQGCYRADSYIDGAAYFALAGERAEIEEQERSYREAGACDHEWRIENAITDRCSKCGVVRGRRVDDSEPWQATDFGPPERYDITGCQHTHWHHYVSLGRQQCIDCGLELPLDDRAAQVKHTRKSGV